MKVKDILKIYDEYMFSDLVIEIRENNYFIQRITSKSFDDFLLYNKFSDLEIYRWFIKNDKIIIDVKEVI